MDHASARENMVECQLRTNKVTDPRLLAALRHVPRERFVPENFTATAYVDAGLPLGDGRMLLAPLLLARLLQLLAAGPEDRALVVGCATGYDVAVLARLAAHVYALDSAPDLLGRARLAFASLGLANVTVLCATMAQGAASHAPYDVILLGGAVAQVPPVLLDQLAEGGRLATVVRSGADLPDGAGFGIGTLFARKNGELSRTGVFDAAAVFLPGFGPDHFFVF